VAILPIAKVISTQLAIQIKISQQQQMSQAQQLYAGAKR
jgi:hypothetical protein